MKRKNKRNLKKILSRLAMTLLCIVLSAIVLILLLSIPDLIWFCRKLISKIPGLESILIDINEFQYIPMMLTIISCSISGILSYIAYRLSQKVGQLSVDSNSVKQAYAAYRIKQYIADTSQIVKKRINEIAELTDLKVNDELIEQWMVIQRSGIIEEDEDFLYTYNKKLKNIVKFYKEQNNEKLTKALESFSQAYFDTDEEEIKFNKKIEYIQNKLNNLSKGGES